MKKFTMEVAVSTIKNRVDADLAGTYLHKDHRSKVVSRLLNGVSEEGVKTFMGVAKDITPEGIANFMGQGAVYANQKFIKTVKALAAGNPKAINKYDRLILDLLKKSPTVTNADAQAAMVKQLTVSPNTASTQRSSSCKSLAALGVISQTGRDFTLNDKSAVWAALTA